MRVLKNIGPYIVDGLVKEGEIMQKAGCFEHGFYL